MVRPLRIEYPGACYHVINRGNRGEQIYFNETDYNLFLDKLSGFADIFDVVIHSYCMMSNHFHLMVTTNHANLSRFMQSFTTSFTISMNNKYHRPGHLFQGRYKAQLVESEVYKNDLSLNPIKIRTYAKLPLMSLKKRLHDYRWSSFRSYLGICRRPDWLDRNFVLSSWGKSSAEKLNNYRKFIEQGLLTDNFKNLKSNMINNIIGSETFRDRVVKKYLTKDFRDIDGREQPGLSVINSLSVHDVINAVSIYFKLDISTRITERKGCNSEARKVAIYLSGKYCRKKASLTYLANNFGLKISGYNMARLRFGQNNENKQMLVQIEKLLKFKSSNVEV